MFINEKSASVSANHNDLSFKELQSVLTEMYNSLTDESKEGYWQKGYSYFEEVNKTFS
jgi:hypothetical protein